MNTDPSGRAIAAGVADESTNPTSEELDVFRNTNFQPMLADLEKHLAGGMHVKPISNQT